MTKSLFPEAEKNPKGMPTLEEIHAFCVQQGLEENDAAYMYWHWDSNGFTVNKKPVQKWRSVIMAWKAAGHLPSQDPRRQPSRFTADRRHDERRGEPGRRSHTDTCICCKAALIPDGLGGLKHGCKCKLWIGSEDNFCDTHMGQCRVCCGCK